MTYECNCQSCGAVFKFKMGHFKCLKCWKIENFTCVDCDRWSNGMYRCLCCFKKYKSLSS